MDLRNAPARIGEAWPRLIDSAVFARYQILAFMFSSENASENARGVSEADLKVNQQSLSLRLIEKESAACLLYARALLLFAHTHIQDN